MALAYGIRIGEYRLTTAPPRLRNRFNNKIMATLFNAKFEVGTDAIVEKSYEDNRAHCIMAVAGHAQQWIMGGKRESKDIFAGTQDFIGSSDVISALKHVDGMNDQKGWDLAEDKNGDLAIWTFAGMTEILNSPEIQVAIRALAEHIAKHSKKDMNGLNAELLTISKGAVDIDLDQIVQKANNMFEGLVTHITSP